MEKIIRVRPLPQSFQIKSVRYPGVSFSPDGPASVLYHTIVAGSDYSRLIGKITNEKTIFNFRYGRMQAVSHYDELLAEEVLLYEHGGSTLTQLPDMFDVETTTTAGHVRNSYVVADTRSSDTVHVYITTKFPYDG